jgi:hypothetical protein
MDSRVQIRYTNWSLWWEFVFVYFWRLRNIYYRPTTFIANTNWKSRMTAMLFVLSMVSQSRKWKTTDPWITYSLLASSPECTCNHHRHLWTPVPYCRMFQYVTGYISRLACGFIFDQRMELSYPLLHDLAWIGDVDLVLRYCASRQCVTNTTHMSNISWNLSLGCSIQ